MKKRERERLKEIGIKNREGLRYTYKELERERDKHRQREKIE